jgi:hypothetical protein
MGFGLALLRIECAVLNMIVEDDRPTSPAPSPAPAAG